MNELDLFSQMGQSQNREIVGGGIDAKSNLQTFNYQGKSLDYGLLNGEPIFNLNAIAELIGIANPRTSIDTGDENYAIKIDNSIVGFAYNRKLHNTGELFLTESGLYMLLMRSNNPNAKPFQLWVTKDVLPTIRKTGSYSLQPQLPKSYKEALKELLNQVEENERLQLANEKQREKIALDKPKVDYAEAILSADNSQSIGDFAKMLSSKGINTGQNRFFSWLRENGYLTADNTPYQKYVDCGYFELLAQNYYIGANKIVGYKTLITPKGQHYFTIKLQKGVKNGK